MLPPFQLLNKTGASTGGGQKAGPQTHGRNFFCIISFLGKFAVKWILKIPPHPAYVATLPCETLSSAKQALKDKLQDSVAAYLSCGGVLNNQIKKGLLRSL